MSSSLVEHPLDYFKKVVIINLPSRTDRRREMEAELAEIGYAADKVTWLDACRPDDPGEFESIGARGCFMSHLSALKRAAAGGASRVLVLEDDCTFARDFVPRLTKIVETISQREWDVFYGGGHPLEPQTGNNELSEIPPDCGVMLTHCVAFNGSAIHRTSAYIDRQLSRPFGHPEGGPMHVDGSYSWARRELRLTTLMADPVICGQRSSRSDIGVRRIWDRLPLVRDVVQNLRAIRRKKFQAE